MIQTSRNSKDRKKESLSKARVMCDSCARDCVEGVDSTQNGRTEAVGKPGPTLGAGLEIVS